MSQFRILSLALFLALYTLSCRAQEGTAPDGFQLARQQLLDEFNDFRREANREYAHFLSQKWEEFTLFQGIPLFEKPKLVVPETDTDGTPPTYNFEIEVLETACTETVLPVPENDESQLATDEPYRGKPFSVPFYGATLPVRYQLPPIMLTSIQESAVVQLWTTFSQTKFTTLLLDMLNYKEKMQMNDWAYFLFTKHIARNLSALKDDNSRLVFRLFLLVQSGYDARLTRIDDFMALLVPTQEVINACPFLRMEGKPYYVLSDRKLVKYTTAASYRLPPNGRNGNALSLQMKRPLLLPNRPKSFAVNAAGLEVSGEINLNKIQFYRDYPQCHLSVYAEAMPDRELHQSLVHSLERQLVGVDSITALNNLLQWVQMGFKYQSDALQFGYEKPLFIEENFYYPYNDCEDRSILFCYLVRQLLGYDALLLRYPNHIAAAVRVNRHLPGDYINVDRKKYLICDPSFIHAKVGRSMRRYKEEKPIILRLK